jgi:hypothetical protein
VIHATAEGFPSTKLIQVDAMKLKHANALAVGDVFDINLVEEIYELKTSLAGKVGASQASGLRSLGKEFKVVHSPRVYDVNTGGWKKGIKVAQVQTLIGLLGLGYSAYTMVNYHQNDEMLNNALQLMENAIAETDPNEKRWKTYACFESFRQYIMATTMMSDEMNLGWEMMKKNCYKVPIDKLLNKCKLIKYQVKHFFYQRE